MNEIPDDDICRRCQCRCDGRATKSYLNDKLVDIHCESCFEFHRIEQYRKDRILRTGLVMHASLWGFERGAYSDRGSPLEDWRWELLARRSAPPRCIPEEDWTSYRRRIDGALALLPDRGEQNYARLSRDLIAESRITARSAETVLGIFDTNGNPVPQPRSYEAVNESMRRITEVVKTVYEPRLWFGSQSPRQGSLQAFVRAESARGHSGEFKGLKVLSYCIAGRAMQTLSMGKHSITLICAEDEDEPRMGIQGIESIEEEALHMLVRATEMWECGALKLQRDAEVSVI